MTYQLPEPYSNQHYYTATQMREAYNAGLEAAATVCDEHLEFPSLTPRHCAESIRALKEQPCTP